MPGVQACTLNMMLYNEDNELINTGETLLVFVNMDEKQDLLHSLKEFAE